MNAFEKLLNVLAKNLGYTVVLVASIILFAIFSDGLLAGTITALSAVIGYTCLVMLYREYRRPAVTSPKRGVTKRPASKKK